VDNTRNALRAAVSMIIMALLITALALVSGSGDAVHEAVFAAMIGFLCGYAVRDTESE